MPFCTWTTKVCLIFKINPSPIKLRFFWSQELRELFILQQHATKKLKAKNLHLSVKEDSWSYFWAFDRLENCNKRTSTKNEVVWAQIHLSEELALTFLHRVLCTWQLSLLKWRVEQRLHSEFPGTKLPYTSIQAHWKYSEYPHCTICKSLNYES